MNLAVLFSVSMAVFCLFNYLPSVHGCSCQRIHAQDHYCLADFVIKAHVRRARPVNLLPDDSIRYIKKPKENEKGHIGPEVPTRQPSLETHKTLNGESEPDVKPAPFGRPGGSPGSFSPGHRASGFEGAAPGSPGTVSTDGDIDVEDGPEVIERAKRHTYRTKNRVSKSKRGAEDLHPPPGKEVIKTRPTVTLTQYKIDIVKVFKGLGNVTKLGRNFLYTSSESFLCNKPLNNAAYILMGRVIAGRMHISLCDFSIEHNEESNPREIKNLIRNLRDRFSKGCAKCHVSVCYPHGKCPAVRRDSSTCVWKDFWSVDSMGAHQHACMKNKGGKCKWYNALNKEKKGRSKM